MIHDADLFSRLSACVSPSAGRAVLTAAIRRKQESAAAMVRVETKAALLIGYSVTFVCAFAKCMTPQGGIGLALSIAAAIYLVAGAACAAAAVRVGAMPLVESVDVVLAADAFARCSDPLDANQDLDSEHAHNLIVSGSALGTSEMLIDLGFQKARWVARSEEQVLRGTILAIALMLRLLFVA